MKLTTKGRYALQALLDMILHTNGKPVKLSDIAIRQDISLQYLEQLLRKLKIAEIVKSIRGPGGGYLLNKRPEDISLESILLAVGESIEYSSSMEVDSNSTKEKLIVSKLIEKLDGSIKDVLDTKLSKFAKD